MATVGINDPAPDVTLDDQDGNPCSLRDLFRQHVVVLFFYPKDGTPVCTSEVCHFRDALEDFQNVGAVVLGVSSDSAESHQRFAQSNAVPFRLLSDPKGQARKAFGVPQWFGIFPGRVTYVIDRNGIVRSVFNSQFGPQKHVDEALATVRGLLANPTPTG